MPIRQRLIKPKIKKVKAETVLKIAYGRLEQRYPQRSPNPTTSGDITVRVRPPGELKFSILQTLSYDNAIRASRGKALVASFSLRDGWQSKYHGLRDAAFQIIEREAGFPDRVLSGAKS